MWKSTVFIFPHRFIVIVCSLVDSVSSWALRDFISMGHSCVWQGFCILKGSLSSDVRHRAVEEASLRFKDFSCYKTPTTSYSIANAKRIWDLFGRADSELVFSSSFIFCLRQFAMAPTAPISQFGNSFQLPLVFVVVP